MSSKTSVGLMLSVLLGGVVGITTPAFGQYMREIARQHAIENPGVPLQHASGPVEYVPKPIEQVANGAIAVVQAKLVRVKSYLDASGRAILTDYMITEPLVVVGSLPTLVARVPTAGTPIILTVVGGETVLDGVTVRSSSPSFHPIKEGTQYLIFLGPSRVPGPNRYGIHYGAIFEVSQDKLRSLMKNADVILQGFTADESPRNLFARIQKAAQPR